jgi:hypothetical protein
MECVVLEGNRHNNCAFFSSIRMFIYSIDTVSLLCTEEQLGGPVLDNRICVVNTLHVTFRNIKV